MLKSCHFRSQSILFDHPIQLNPIAKVNFPLRNSISALKSPCFLSLRSSLSHQIQKRRVLVCARRKKREGVSPRSRKSLLELVSRIALDFTFLPQPLDLLTDEFTRGNGNGVYLEFLNALGGRAFNGLRRRRKGRGKLLWFVFISICGLGLLSWRISELDLFLRALSFCLVGIFLIRLWRRKAIEEWLLVFLFGTVLLSSRLGKVDVKFWVEKLRICSPDVQVVIGIRERKRRSGGKAF